jgi:hypothetical protein
MGAITYIRRAALWGWGSLSCVHCCPQTVMKKTGDIRSTGQYTIDNSESTPDKDPRTKSTLQQAASSPVVYRAGDVRRNSYGTRDRTDRKKLFYSVVH